MNNPLAEKQREKSGSTTFSKYFYQYNWALYELLDRQNNTEEYVVFMEMHEDVVFSSSLKSEGNFDFYQIKDTKTHTLEALIKKPKDTSNSIIGKCLLSIHNKPYKDRVKTVNLVISNGFSIDKHLEKQLKLKKISTSDLKDESQKTLSDSIALEIGEQVDISLLNFLNSDLSPTYETMEQQVIGLIAQVSSNIFSGLPNRSNNSYTVLIDALQRKGICDYDFTDWDSFVKHKGITSQEVKLVLQENTSTGFSDIRSAFDDISSDLGIKGYEKSNIKNNLERFHTDIVFSKARQCIHAVDVIEDYLLSNNFELEQISPLILESVKNSLTLHDVDIKIAIIYCIVQKVLNYEESA